MLLCCFKEPKRSSSNSRFDSFSGADDEAYAYRANGRAKSAKLESKTGGGRMKKMAAGKERAPLNKEEKRLIKQKSRESLRSATAGPEILQQQCNNSRFSRFDPDELGEDDDKNMVVVLDGELRSDLRRRLNF